ncbi:mycothiol-dependent nitroreductase Rv2466c family protein [Streptomyces sp. NPDC002537]
MTTSTTDEAAARTDVVLWADPVCVWTYVTYRWLREAESVRPLSLSLRPTVLGYLEGAPGLDDEHARFLARAPRPVRVLAAARAEHGEDAVAPLYEATARRFHGTGGLYDGLAERARGLDRQDKRALQGELLERSDEVIAEALTEIGLPAALAAEQHSPAWDEQLRASHESIPTGGRELDILGVPVISVDGGVGVFGPVLGAVPAGERAGRLWDGFRALALEDDFLELRRVTPRPLPRPELLH